MNRLPTPLIALLLAIFVLFAAPKITKADLLVDRVYNGNFESDPLGLGWQQYEWGYPTFGMIGAWGADNVHGGTRSAQLAVYNSTNKSLMQSVEVKDKAYRIDFSFWYKVMGDDAFPGPRHFTPAMDYEIRSMTRGLILDQTGCQNFFTNITTPGPSDLRGGWRQATCLFEVFDGKEIAPDSYTLEVKLQSSDDVVKLYVDDISVISRTYDRVPPILTIDSPTWGSTVTTPTITVTGSVSDQETGLKTLEYDSGGGHWTPISYDAQGHFSASLSLAPGHTTIPFRALDRGENYTWRYYEITYQPPGQVLGISTELPTIKDISTSTSRITLGNRSAINPFPGYRGRLWARRVKANDGSISYVVATSDAGSAGGIKVYNAAGKLIQTTSPFGKFKPGYNLTMAVDPSTEKIFLAMAPKKYGSTVTIDEFRAGQLHFVNSVQITKTTLGNMRVKFLLLRAGTTELVAVVDGKPASMKIWRYSTTSEKFSRDTSFDMKRIRLSSTTITLR